MLTRKPTWEADLDQYCRSQLDQPFRYGVRDCCMFVCGAIKAITGVDVAEEFRGKYTTALGAARTIKRVTGTGCTVEHAARYVTKRHHMPELSSVLLAQRGDVVLYDAPEGPILGIVSLNGRDALFVTESAMKPIPIAECRAAWRV